MAMIFRQPGKTGIGNLEAGKPASSFNGKNRHSSSNERKKIMKINSVIFYLCAGMCSSSLIDSAFTMNNFNKKQFDQQNDGHNHTNSPMMSISNDEDVDMIEKGILGVASQNGTQNIQNIQWGHEGNIVITLPEEVQNIQNLPGIEENVSNFKGIHAEYLDEEQDMDKDNHRSISFRGIAKFPGTLIRELNEYITEIVIPSNVISIDNYAFFGYEHLKRVIIPNSVTSIGQNAFFGCTNLKEVIISNNVRSIGNFTFAHCNSLKKSIIPNNVTSIGNFVFAYCNDLKEIVIPNSVISIGNYAFEGCGSLKHVEILNGKLPIDLTMFNECSDKLTIVVPDNFEKISNVKRSALLGIRSKFKVRTANRSVTLETMSKVCSTMSKSEVKNFKFIDNEDRIIASCRQSNLGFVIYDANGREVDFINMLMLDINI